MHILIEETFFQYVLEIRKQFQEHSEVMFPLNLSMLIASISRTERCLWPCIVCVVADNIHLVVLKQSEQYEHVYNHRINKT